MRTDDVKGTRVETFESLSGSIFKRLHARLMMSAKISVEEFAITRAKREEILNFVFRGSMVLTILILYHGIFLP